jgi:general secretion pathway protein C
MSNPRERHLRPAVLFTTLALVAFFLTQGAVQLLALKWLALDPAASAQPSIPTSTSFATSRPPKDGMDILRRNIFDSASGPMDKEPAPPPSETSNAAPEVIDPNAPPPLCDGTMRLVGLMHNARYPEWSFASVSSAGAPANVLMKGSTVESKEVAAIFEDAVYMRSGGALCRLTMFAAAPGAAASPPPQEAAAATSAASGEESAGGIPAAELDAGIKAVSDTSFQISRSVLNKILSNQAELMRSARLSPQQENGRTVGVKLRGIRRTSILRRLGLQNEDMLRTINGFDMSDPKSALEAYTKLRAADRISVSITRRGTPMTVEYSIR